MALMLLCPTCSRPITASESPPSGCPQCGAVLPSSLVAQVQEKLERQPVPKPSLLRILPAFLGLWSLGAFPMSLTVLFSSGGTYTINGVQVTRHEFMRR